MTENLMRQNLAQTIVFDLVDQSILLLNYKDTAICTAHLMHSYGRWKSVFKIECRCKKATSKCFLTKELYRVYV